MSDKLFSFVALRQTTKVSDQVHQSADLLSTAEREFSLPLGVARGGLAARFMFLFLKEASTSIMIAY